MHRIRRICIASIIALCVAIALSAYASPSPSQRPQPPAIKRQGGPDGYGYRYIDNRSEPTGPTYNWVEIASDLGGAGTNTGLVLNDQSVSIPLNGFVFPYYGMNYSDSIQICSNGFVGFGLYSTFFDNTALPYTSHIQPGIYPFWSDMDPSEGGAIWYYFDNANQRLIIEWNQVAHNRLPFYRHTFQLRLYTSGTMECMYKSMSAYNDSCTVGLQGPAAGANNQYLQYSYNSGTNSPVDSLAIQFYLQTGNVLAYITAAGGAPLANAQVEITTIPNLAKLTDATGHALFTNILTGSNYRIRAVAQGYTGATSATVFTVPLNDTVRPSLTLSSVVNVIRPPRNLVALGGQSEQIQLLWQRPVSSANTFIGYRIWRITSVDTTMIAYRSTITDTTYIDMGLTNGLHYGYYVQSAFVEGISIPTATVYAYPRPQQMYSSSTRTFQWVDMRTRSIGLPGGDDAITQSVALPFRFPFFEHSWDSVQCSTNGFIGYNLQPNDAFQRQVNIPYPTRPNEIIAGCWLDLVVANDSIRYGYDTLNTRFVITFYHAQIYQNPTTIITMQYVLYPNGTIEINYQQELTNGASMPTGVENRDGTSGALIYLPQQTNTSITWSRINPPMGTVVGTLHGNPGNVAIAGTVTVGSQTVTTTLSNAQFQFLNVPTSVTLLQANAVGYQSLSQLLTVGMDSITTMNMVLSPAGNVAPDTFYGQSNFDDRVRLHWVRNGGSNLTGYRIYRNGNLWGTLGAAATQFDDSSQGSSGETVSNWYRLSATYSTTPTQVWRPDSLHLTHWMAPAPPTNVTAATTVDSTILIRWSPPTTNADGTPLVDLSSFYVYRDTTYLGSVPVSRDSFIYTAPNRTYGYNYRVKAVDDQFNQSSPASVFYAAQAPWAVAPYIWFNSVNWTNLQLRTDAGVWVPLGFTFPFFGTNYDSVFVTSNGFMSFNSWQWYPRQCPGFPSTDAPNAVIAPLWDDLDCSSGAVKATSQNGIFIVSYENIQYAPTHSTVGSFQVRLDTYGTITFSYQTSPNLNDYGVGIEDGSGTSGWQIWLNGGGSFIPEANTSIAFWSRNRPNGLISGRTIRGNATPFAGASINVMDNWTAITPANGTYNLTLPAGTWNLRMTAPCMVPDTVFHLVTLLGGDTVRLADTLRQPQISTNPTSLEVQVRPGQTVNTPLTIQNTGDAPLHWSVSVPSHTDFAPSPHHAPTWLPMVFSHLAHEPAFIPNPLPVLHSELDRIRKSRIPEPPAISSINSLDQTWPVDGYGYWAVDINELNYPNWITFRDITTIGTQVITGDDNATMTPMDGFNFNYYGNSYSSIRVNTNGVAQFVNSSDPIGSRTNVQLPTATATNAVLPMWDDLETAVYKYYDAINNVFILEWDGDRYPNVTDTVRFEVQFHANTQSMLFLYQRIPVSLMSATVGIQGGTGSGGYYIQNFYGASAGQGLPANMTNYGIAFFHPGNGQLNNWLYAIPDTGTVQPGGQGEQIQIQVQLDTTYHPNDVLHADMVFTTNACSTRTVSVTTDVLAVNETMSSLPKVFALHPNYPNPFNPTTEIRFDLPTPNFTRLTIYNITGRKVTQLVNQALPAGFHSVRFNATGLASGVYFYRLESGRFISQRKMIVLK